MNNQWKPKMLFKINLFKFIDIDPEQEIISVKLISIEGVIVTFRNKICLFYIKNNKLELDFTISEQQKNISFSSLIYYKTHYYLINALQESIKIIEINKIQNDDSSNLPNPLPRDIEAHKKIIDTCINTLLNRKSDFIIKRLDTYSIQISIEFVFIKLEFNLDDLSHTFSLINNDEFLRKDIEDEIQKLKLNEKEKNIDYGGYTKFTIEKIILLSKTITSEISESFTEESEIDKIKREDFSNNYEVFKIWQEILKKKRGIKNLFNEDDEFDLENKLMTTDIKTLIPKKNNFNFEELNIDQAFNFVNANFYSSNDINEIEEQQKSKSAKIKVNSEPGKLYKLNKDCFQIYLEQINEKKKIQTENIEILGDIISQIKYYLQEIKTQNSNNLIKFYRESILDILNVLETGLHFVFLFICTILLADLIHNELNKRSNLIINNIRYQTNSDYNFNKKIKEKNSANFSWSSENDDNLKDAISDDDLFLEYKETNNEADLKKNKETKINKDNTCANLDKKFENNMNNKRFSFTKNDGSKNNNNLIRLNKKNLTNKLYTNKNNLSFTSLKHEKNLIELLTSNFCNTIIDYVSFFCEELKLLDLDSPDERLIDFFTLVNKCYKSKDINNEIREFKTKKFKDI